MRQLIGQHYNFDENLRNDLNQKVLQAKQTNIECFATDLALVRYIGTSKDCYLCLCFLFLDFLFFSAICVDESGDTALLSIKKSKLKFMPCQ